MSYYKDILDISIIPVVVEQAAEEEGEDAGSGGHTIPLEDHCHYHHNTSSWALGPLYIAPHTHSLTCLATFISI